MSALDAFIPVPRLRELDTIDVGVPVGRAFEVIRTLDLGGMAIARGLFALRAVPDHLTGRAPEPWDLRMQTMIASEHGFRLLAAEPARGFVIGAIGKVWEPVIPFVDVPSAAYASYSEPGEAKVAWELRADPLTAATSRIAIEVRVTTTDDPAWQRFRAYFALIGPFSRLLRKLMLRHVAQQLGMPEDAESTMPLVPQAQGRTRLLVRVRGHWAPERLVWRARASLLVHRFMEHEQLRNLKARAEASVPSTGRSDGSTPSA